MKTITVIELTDEEREALKTLSSIDCSGIPCNDCSFDSEDGCLATRIEDVANKVL